ncbi:MAG: type II toxin-antitoxin system VapC family toxin [Nitrospirae bacterium]|nr:type II toxin-antitoxin system VapC family toxin [Nitrospirota bacterium]
MNYLVDTDILIDWLRGKKTVIRFFQETKGIFYYSSITRKELLSACNSTAQKERILNLLRTMRIVRVDPLIAIKASEFLNKYSSSPLYKSDSLIAATAYVKKMVLVTRNRKHFDFIEEIQLLTPEI